MMLWQIFMSFGTPLTVHKIFNLKVVQILSIGLALKSRHLSIRILVKSAA